MKPRTWVKTKTGVSTYKPWVLRAAGRDNMGIIEKFRDRWKHDQSKSRCEARPPRLF